MPSGCGSYCTSLLFAQSTSLISGFPCYRTASPVNLMKFSPDGEFFATAGLVSCPQTYFLITLASITHVRLTSCMLIVFNNSNINLKIAASS